MEKIYKSIGHSIRKHRKAWELTQAELAEKLELSIRHLQNIEYGKVDLSLSTLVKISRFFDISVHSLFEDPMTSNALTHLDFLPVGLQICDTKGLVLYTNNQSVKYHGYTKKEVCGKFYI